MQTGWNHNIIQVTAVGAQLEENWERILDWNAWSEILFQQNIP